MALVNVTDAAISHLQHNTGLQKLYLKRCAALTDASIGLVAAGCRSLVELDVGRRV